jgi:hypothetical protein
MPDRFETPILNMICRKKALTVLELIRIRPAISLLVSPADSSLTVSFSRQVRRNWSPLAETRKDA